MELILQQALPHQQKAVDAICAALDGVQITAPTQFYENPHIMLTDPRLAENVRELQNAVPPEYRSNTPIGNCLNLDIKMETGERVIIVMGAINALESRVSGTLVKYNSCIA